MDLVFLLCTVLFCSNGYAGRANGTQHYSTRGAAEVEPSSLQRGQLCANPDSQPG